MKPVEVRRYFSRCWLAPVLAQLTLSYMPDDRIGRVLCGKYTLLRELGQGGMAAVFEATHRNGLRVAIKVLAPELAANGDIKARFLREGYVANAVGHPRVVRVLDDDIDQGMVFLVLELLRGETVGARAQRYSGRLPEAAALAVGIDVCGALEAAHAQGVVHRDLKPENLFLDDSTGVRVLDFGIARFKSTCATTLGTRTGVLLGTPGFMPKEQALGEMEAIDARTDLWALGATLHAILAGKLVHEARTPEAMLVKVATEAVPSVKIHAPWISDATSAVIDRALSMNPDDRFQSAAEMREALERAYTELPPDEIAVASTMLLSPITPQRQGLLTPVAGSLPRTPARAALQRLPFTPVNAVTSAAEGETRSDAPSGVPFVTPTTPESGAAHSSTPPVSVPATLVASTALRSKLTRIALAVATVAAIFVGREIQARASGARLREAAQLTVRLGPQAASVIAPAPNGAPPVTNAAFTPALGATVILAPNGNPAAAVAPAVSAAKPARTPTRPRTSAPSDPFENP